ncbi:hypothetical protein AAFS68_003313 [Vibrio cholerae]|uniref:hypothetical protein n=1 Tax=Vibrio cholerae TaxID=666 RepID=UPI00028E04DA|nr:hypothetical protein [Vibrio cholerae]ATD28861.1 hypothetical protein FORC55_2877 [Vibrio cholerae]EGR0490922.1 hypothetical protein [Vibrio cholerae]EGR0665026.1 hypothetical protein [Vibrio cholerae]EGR0723911.1 hypothetical protein [Vibrio cholerae]EGR1110626.1 hypothetical protein [Vibrio cholerae]
MNRLHVDDLSVKDLCSTNYHLAIFSCGYEERCIDVAEKLSQKNISNTLVLTFDQHYEDPTRVSCLDYYNTSWSNCYILEVNQREIKTIFSKVSDIIEGMDKPEQLKVLIDYTSMSRVWYSSILNYLINFYDGEVVIDLTYTTAIYHELDLNVELGETKVIPGCEGISLTKKQNAAIFMLGFDEYGPQRLFNILNPNKIFGIMASPAASYEYEEECIQRNKNFIMHNLGGEENLIKLPINSLSSCYEHMTQILSPLCRDYNVSFIPFGPKPHILTSILCSFNFPNVTCMYSEYIRNKTVKVESSGDIIISRVYRKKEDYSLYR